MIDTKMNIRMNITHIWREIQYVENNVHKEPGRAIETYYGELQNYVGNTLDTQPEDLYETYLGKLYRYERLNTPKNTNVQ